MRKSLLVGGLATALASMFLVLPPPTLAAPGGGGGSGEVFSDLYIVLRDENGVPITVSFDTLDGPVECVQPISYTEIPGIGIDDRVMNEADGRLVYLVPLVGELPASAPLAAAAAEEEEDAAEPCDPQPAYAQFVSEVELERLNLVRTSDTVLWKKLAETGARLAGATEITLDGAGRITTDGTPIDAAPEQAAMYASAAGADPATQPGGLMDTGTLPGLATSPAFIQQGPDSADGFDRWMLAAAAIGTAGGKSVPLTIDAVQYYSRVAAPGADLRPPGGVEMWTETPVLDDKALGYSYIDYTEFSYTRSEVFSGCTTWLDVGRLTWMSGPVLERVDFNDLVDFPTPNHTVSNVAGFAQMADDVRSVINFLHENEVVVDENGIGFFIDPVFEQTCAEQAEMVVELNQPADAVDPTVTITAAPTAMTTATDATFAFTATDAASVLCVLDSGPIERCLSPMIYTGLQPGTHTFNVIAMGVAGNFVSATHTWDVIRPGDDSMMVPLSPLRFADTRPGWVAADGLFAGTGPVPAGGVVQVPIAGRGGIPSDAKAVVANVTLVNAAGPGYATVFPCGPVPNASSVNYATGGTVANEVMAKLSPIGSICVYTSATADVLVDVDGFVPWRSDFVSLTPVRLADTRPTPVAAGGTLEVQIAGLGGVPADAAAVVANVTLVNAAGPGYATVFPCGPVPNASSVNYVAGGTAADEVVAKLSPTGSICVHTSAAADVLVDVVGYVPPGSEFASLTPVRLADTRPTPLAAGGVLEVQIAGLGGVPADAAAVVANVTLVNAAGPGYATVFPCGPLPNASSVNYVAGGTVANEVMAKLSSTGSICVYTFAAADVLVDVVGYM